MDARTESWPAGASTAARPLRRPAVPLPPVGALLVETANRGRDCQSGSWSRFKLDITDIAGGLTLDDEGLWVSSDREILSYPDGGHDRCFAVEDRSFWFRHRNDCLVSVVRAFPPSGPIFDVGGGNGAVSLALIRAGIEVVLVEPGRVGATNARKRGVETVINASTRTARFRAASLPAVGLFDVVEHMEDDLGFLRSIGELMVRGGRLYLTVPAYPFLWSADDELAGHFRRYTAGDLRRTVEAAGFEVEFATYLFRFLPLPILFFRALPYRLGLSRPERALRRPVRDHAAGGGWLARLLTVLLRPELGRLNRRRPMRLGGSCLLVARTHS